MTPNFFNFGRVWVFLYETLRFGLFERRICTPGEMTVGHLGCGSIHIRFPNHAIPNR